MDLFGIDDDELDARIKARLAQATAVGPITEADDPDYRDALDRAHAHGALTPRRRTLAAQRAEDERAAAAASRASGLSLSAPDRTAALTPRVRAIRTPISAPLNDGDVTTAQRDAVTQPSVLGAARARAKDPIAALLERAPDLGVSAVKGAVDLTEAGVGLADLATGGHVGKFAEDHLDYRPQEAQTALDEMYSEPQQAANREVAETKGFLPTIGAMLKNPSTIAHQTIESVPIMLAAGALGGAAGGGALLAGASEGILGAGSAVEQRRHENANGLVTDDDVGGAVLSGVWDGVVSAALGKLAGRLGYTDPDVLLAKLAQKPSLRRVAAAEVARGLKPHLQSMAGEGAEELLQGLGEQTIANAVAGRPLMEGVPESAAQGMLAGMAMGAGGSAIEHADGPRTTPVTPATPPARQSPVLPPSIDPVVRPNPPAAPSQAAQAVRAQVDDMARASRPAASQAPQTGIRAVPPTANTPFPVLDGAPPISPEQVAAAEVSPERWDATDRTGGTPPEILADESPAYGAAPMTTDGTASAPGAFADASASVPRLSATERAFAEMRARDAAVNAAVENGARPAMRPTRDGETAHFTQLPDGRLIAQTPVMAKAIQTADGKVISTRDFPNALTHTQLAQQYLESVGRPWSDLRDVFQRAENMGGYVTTDGEYVPKEAMPTGARQVRLADEPPAYGAVERPTDEPKRTPTGAISAAAIKLPDGSVHTGRSHWDALNAAVEAGSLNRTTGQPSEQRALSQAIDGFVDDNGVFLDRAEAAKRVKKLRQLSPWYYKFAKKSLSSELIQGDYLADESPAYGGAPALGHESRVSTRVPSAKKAEEDALRDNLSVGMESFTADPKTLAKNASVIQQYPNVKVRKGSSPMKVAEALLAHAVDNLLWLYDQVPADVRGRSKLWYVGARKIADDWSAQYQITPVQAAAILAVQSPQKDWFQNVDLARRIIEIAREQQHTPWSPEMTAVAVNKVFKAEEGTLIQRRKIAAGTMTREEMAATTRAKQQLLDRARRLLGERTLAELSDPIQRAQWLRVYDEAHHAREYPLVTPEGTFGTPALTGKGEPQKIAWGAFSGIAKALVLLEDGSRGTVSSMLGNEHKVRSFYNNIIAPDSDAGDVTIDTHAVAAALLRPLAGGSTEVKHNFGGGGASSSATFGSQGTYGLYAEAYRRAAAARGVLPREMQSITWEAIRGLFTAGWKRPENIRAVDTLWKEFHRGKHSLDDTRDGILRLAGGITPPEWLGSSAAAHADAGHADDAGGVPDAERAGRGDPVRRGGSADPVALPGVVADDSPDYRTAGHPAPADVGGDGGRADGAPSPYTRTGGTGAGEARVLGTRVPALARLSPNPETVARQAEGGRIAPPMLELNPQSPASVRAFSRAITAAKRATPYGAAVYIYPSDDYAGMRLFVSESGKTGFALKGEDIVSVFSTEKGGRAAHALAIAEGGRTLDAFDTVLPDLYASNGMRVVSRLAWDDTQAPEGWDKATFWRYNHGEPDVVFMVYDPTFVGDRLAGERVSSYDEAVARQQAARSGEPARVMDEPPDYATAPAAVSVPIPVPAFYSRLERAIASFPASRGTVEQWAAHLAKDVNRDEVEWTTVADLLRPALQHAEAQRMAQSTQGEWKQALKTGGDVQLASARHESAKTLLKMMADHTAEGRKQMLTKAEVAERFDRNKIELELVELGEDDPGLAAAQARNVEADHRWEEARAALNALPQKEPGFFLNFLGSGGDPLGLEGFVSAEEMQRMQDYVAAREEHHNAQRALNDITYNTANKPKYGQYTLPGGDGYREVLIRLKPRVERIPTWDAYDAAVKAEEVAANRAHDVMDGNDHHLQAERNQEWREAQAAIEAARKAWMAAGSPSPSKQVGVGNAHWRDQRNILAHFRIKTRMVNGEKVLHAEEIQSDWHQKGRETGYATDADRQAYARAEGEYDKKYDAYVAARAAQRGDAFDSPELQRAAKEMQAAREALNVARRKAEGATPDAPFKATEDWAMLVAKHVIDRAVKGGFDRVAWTTGQHQGDRYDLSKQVDDLIYDPATAHLTALKDDEVVHEGKYDPRALGDVVGKDMAEKLLAQPMSKVEWLGEKRQRLQGEDLKISPRGMVEFYDRMLPRALKAYGKKVGVPIEIEEREIAQADGKWVYDYAHGREPTQEDLRHDIKVSRASQDPDVFDSLEEVEGYMEDGATFSEAMDQATEGTRRTVKRYMELTRKAGAAISLPSFPITPALKQLVNEKGQFLMDEPGAAPAPTVEELAALRAPAATSAREAEVAKVAFGSERKYKIAVNGVRKVQQMLARAKLPSERTRVRQIEAHEAEPLVNLRGAVLSDPYVAARAMATQRSPLMEHLSVMHLAPVPEGETGLGEVVLHTRDTSGALNFVSFGDDFLDQIVADARRAGTKAVLLGHNHPSGYAVASKSADVPVTVHAAEYLAKHGIALMGQIVIDHDEFAWINHDGSHINRVAFDSGLKPKYTTAVSANRPSLQDPHAVAQLVAKANHPDAVTVLLLDTQYRVVASTARELSDLARSTAPHMEWVTDLMKRTGAQKYVLGIPEHALPAFMERVNNHQRMSRQYNIGGWGDDLLDVIRVSANGGASSGGDSGWFTPTLKATRSFDAYKHKQPMSRLIGGAP